MARLTIRPTDNWRWFFDDKHDCLMLDISNDMLFRSRYSSKMLTPDAFGAFPFSVADAEKYYQFYQQCQILPLTEPQKIELVLNAIIASSHLKPVLPRSWYFVQQPMLFTPRLGQVVEAQLQGTNDNINLIVVEDGDVASLCLLAEPVVTMAGKRYCLADVIKVMNDRLAAKDGLKQFIDENDDEQYVYNINHIALYHTG